jgi:hypothetical protein
MVLPPYGFTSIIPTVNWTVLFHDEFDNEFQTFAKGLQPELLSALPQMGTQARKRQVAASPQPLAGVFLAHRCSVPEPPLPKQPNGRSCSAATDPYALYATRRSCLGKNDAGPYGVARQESASSLHGFSDCRRLQACLRRSKSTRLCGQILDSQQRPFVCGQGILDLSSSSGSVRVASSNSLRSPQLEPRDLNKIAETMRSSRVGSSPSSEGNCTCRTENYA